MDLTAKRKSTSAVVRLTTSVWHDGKGIYVKKSLVFLKRVHRREGISDYITEDCSCGGADQVVERITNLNTVEDGVYRVNAINETSDWETGNVEDWDYELVPFKA